MTETPKTFEEFREVWIKRHEEDNNKHALQWFLNDIFDDTEKLLQEQARRNEEIIDKYIKTDLQGSPLSVCKTLWRIKKEMGLK